MSSNIKERAAQSVFDCLRPEGGLRYCTELRGAWRIACSATNNPELSSPDLVRWAEYVLGEERPTNGKKPRLPRTTNVLSDAPMQPGGVVVQGDLFPSQGRFAAKFAGHS